MEEEEEEQMRAARIGGLRLHNASIQLMEYSSEWRALFVREAERVRAVLGERVRMLEHVGSTSVPGLAAKPIIDMLLAVADSADEPAYVPAMEAAGYMLRIREPENGTSIDFSKARTRTSISTCFRSDVLKSTECSCFATGCEATKPIGTFTNAPSGSWRNRLGSTCRTTSTRRRRWWRKSSRAPELPVMVDEARQRDFVEST
jgi:GrpB-like predicted nucleotidyltransferase (UPF0157 family)